MAFHEGNEFSLSRETGRVKNLAGAAQKSASSSSLGIAHTRCYSWCCYCFNTHPMLAMTVPVMVHNGVIENGTLNDFSPRINFLQKLILKYCVTDRLSLF